MYGFRLPLCGFCIMLVVNFARKKMMLAGSMSNHVPQEKGGKVEFEIDPAVGYCPKSPAYPDIDLCL
jgi:hypothetical protein